MNITATSGPQKLKAVLVILALALFVGSLAMSVSPTTAQETDSPTFEAHLAWENVLRIPGWTEVQVTLTNETSQWEGTLQIVDRVNKVTYQQPLELPAHSRKTYRIPLFISKAGQIQVALLDADGEGHSQSLPRKSISVDQRLCAIFDPLNSFSFSKEAGCAVSLLLDDAAAFPESPMAWDTLDVLLINGALTAEMTDAQKEALVAWVNAGGRLIIGGGAALPQVIAGLPPSLVQHVKLGSFDAAAGITLVRPAAGAQVVYDATSTSAIVTQGVGQGQVDVAGWDLAQEELRGWLSTRWSKDAIPATNRLPSGITISTIQTPSYQLMQIPIASRPEFWQWFILFLVYILLMGPATWFIVRRLGRPILAWILIPAWIILGVGVLSLWLNGTFARTFPLVHEIAFVSAPGSGLPSRTLQGTAIFAPHSTEVRWSMTGTPRPLQGSYGFNQNYYNEGAPFPATVTWENGNVQIAGTEIRGPITWGMEGLTTAPEITLDLTLGNGESSPQFTGTILSSVPLKNARLYLNDVTYRVPLTDTVPAGVEVAITQPITATQTVGPDYTELCYPLDYAPDPYYYSPYYYSSVPMTEVATSNNRCYLAATTEGVPFASQDLGGTYMGETCLLITVPCPSYAKGNFTNLPATSGVDAESKGWVEPNDLVFINAPQTVIYYTFPIFMHPQKITGLTIVLQSPDPAIGTGELSQIHRVELWDWETETWDAQALSIPKTTLRFEEVKARRFFDIDQGLRIQFTPVTGTDWLSIQTHVTLDGTW